MKKITNRTFVLGENGGGIRYVGQARQSCDSVTMVPTEEFGFTSQEKVDMIPLPVERRLRRVIDAYRIHATLPVEIESVAERMGFEIQYRKHIAPVFGIAICQDAERVIVVNADLGASWQRAIIAHELGHWIAGHLDNGGRFESNLAEFKQTIEEQEACTIAALLLIPRCVIENATYRSCVQQRCDVPYELVRLRMQGT